MFSVYVKRIEVLTSDYLPGFRSESGHCERAPTVSEPFFFEGHGQTFMVPEILSLRVMGDGTWRAKTQLAVYSIKMNSDQAYETSSSSDDDDDSDDDEPEEDDGPQLTSPLTVNPTDMLRELYRPEMDSQTFDRLQAGVRMVESAPRTESIEFRYQRHDNQLSSLQSEINRRTSFVIDAQVMTGQSVEMVQFNGDGAGPMPENPSPQWGGYITLNTSETNDTENDSSEEHDDPEF